MTTTIKYFITIITTLVAFVIAPTVFGATITVTTADDIIAEDGACSFSEAIQNANDQGATHADCAPATVGMNVIAFNIPGAGPHSIAIAGGARNINSPIHIQGISQPGASCGSLSDLSDRNLLIELSGNISFNNGSEGSIVEGIAIAGSPAIRVGTSDIQIICNHIGVNTAGTNRLSDAHFGIELSFGAQFITIGGGAPGDRNIISGHTENALYSNAPVHNIFIRGNYIGTDISGSHAIDNCARGINFFDFTEYIYIGGEVEGQGNLLSGNGLYDYFGAAHCAPFERFRAALGTEDNAIPIQNIFIQNNTIGLDSTGSYVIGNGAGIGMVLSGAVISGNIVSGNQIAGIGAWGENITITGNYVGTDSTGMIGLTNISDDTDTGDFPFFGAVTVYGNNITIGGPLASDRNIISGNDGDGYVGALGGILIVPDFENGEPSQNITILNNYIGVAADGVTPLSNATSGIFMLGGAIDSLIQNNIIANSLSNPFFPSAGVIGFENTVFNLPIRNVAILENSIYGQTFAIDYFSDPDGQFDPNEWILVGINPNDPGDTDEGPNDLQNYPVITQASAQNGNALITFSADFQAGDYRIEFFRNSQEVRWLESFVGFMTITHAGNGPQVFTATLPLLLDDIVTATATRINPVALSGFGSTSEGGNPFRVTLPTATTPRRSSGGGSRLTPAQLDNLGITITEQPGAPSAPSTENPFGGNLCPAHLIITNNMKQGDRDGRMSTYNRGIVTQIHILQGHMNRLLLDEYGQQASGPVDGIFGPLTKRGVERLQRRLNQLLEGKITPLVIDGIVGPFTRAAINMSC